jgi:hypothetical protein
VRIGPRDDAREVARSNRIELFLIDRRFAATGASD